LAYNENPLIPDATFLKRLLDMLQKQLGQETEVVLHDLRGDYGTSIVDIRHGYITNRKVGGCGSNLGLEVIKGTSENGDKYNYVTSLPDGRLLRSSSLYFRDEQGKVIGALCINTDITQTLKFENYLHNHNQYEVNENPVKEVFVTEVNQLLEHLIQHAQQECQKLPCAMTKQDRMEFLRYLDEKGAFLITKSGERVQEYLGISKFTLYSYLDSIRTNRT
jgi:predicted transcriptional regulator YheO